MNRAIETIPAESMDALVHYGWPGNIRELQNLMERAVILSNGPVLRIPDGEFASGAPAAAGQAPAALTLEAAERAAILRALDESSGRVGGENGAAHKLGMKRTTLQAKMRILGIQAKSAAQSRALPIFGRQLLGNACRPQSICLFCINLHHRERWSAGCLLSVARQIRCCGLQCKKPESPNTGSSGWCSKAN
jgi:hypothetical protein